MKTKTISVIREILALQVANAGRNFKALKKKLEQKYNTEWLTDKMLEDFESKALKDLNEEFDEANEIFEDFENHQW